MHIYMQTCNYACIAQLLTMCNECAQLAMWYYNSTLLPVPYYILLPRMQLLYCTHGIMHNIHVCMYMHVSFIMMFTTFSRNSGNSGCAGNRGCVFTSFPLSVIENKRKYTKAVAILSGKMYSGYTAVEQHFLLLECFVKIILQSQFTLASASY